MPTTSPRSQPAPAPWASSCSTSSRASGREVDTVLVATGGGGLMAGVATAVADVARVVAVEPVTAPTLHAALAAGEPVDVAVSGVAADSLGARRIGALGWEAARRHDVMSVLVDDEAILDARRVVWERYRLVLEAGAAAPVAALLTGGYQPGASERVAVVLCGANTDPADLSPHTSRRRCSLSFEHSLKREEAVMTTRDKLLDAAATALAEDGVAGVSARTVAARAGVNQALVFYHFGSVSGLLDAAVHQSVDLAVAAYRDRLSDVSTLAELLVDRT